MILVPQATSSTACPSVCTYGCSYFQQCRLAVTGFFYPITWLAYVEFQGASGVEKLLNQGLGEHGGGEKNGAPALTVDGSHQAVRDQPLVDFTFGIQIWVENKAFILWFLLRQYLERKKKREMCKPEMTWLVIAVLPSLMPYYVSSSMMPNLRLNNSSAFCFQEIISRFNRRLAGRIILLISSLNVLDKEQERN